MVPKLTICWLCRSDLVDVLEIEADCFPAENRWSEEQFAEVLREANTICMVARDSRCIVHGYVVYRLYRGTLVLLNLAVSPESQRQGVGTQIIERLKDKLDHTRRTSIELVVRERNLPAQKFFRSMGFRAICVVRDHYPDTDESGYLMRFRVGEPERRVNRVSAYLET